MKDLMRAAFMAIMENSQDMIFLKDENLVYQAASMPFVKMVRKERVEDIVGHTDDEIFADKNLAKRYVADDKRLMAIGRDLIDYVEPITEENGQARYGSTSKYILHDASGKIIGILGISRDITRDFCIRQRYQQELRYLFKLPEDTYAVCYIDIDAWRVISQRRQSIGDGEFQVCTTVEELSGAAIESIVDRDSKASVFYRNFTPDYLSNIYDSGRTTMAFKYRRLLSDGSIRWVRNEVHFMTDVDNEHLCAVLLVKDIDEVKRAEETLEIAARTDKMTMLLNRETTMEYIRQILKNEAGSQHALFMLDLDNFKSLNDTYGHQEGDDFLITIASELKGCFREHDVVGRIGGDEFFALMRNVMDITQAQKKAQELLGIINQCCKRYPDLALSGSIGISIYPGDGTTLEELYSKVDDALYIAKRNGKNQFACCEK